MQLQSLLTYPADIAQVVVQLTCRLNTAKTSTRHAGKAADEARVCSCKLSCSKERTQTPRYEEEAHCRNLPAAWNHTALQALL